MNKPGREAAWHLLLIFLPPEQAGNKWLIWAEETAWWCEQLARKHEDWSSNPQNSLKCWVRTAACLQFQPRKGKTLQQAGWQG